ncbi:MAG: tRNA pseudouridine(38-40) synthase TruA [Clostridia bacterium]|nr:tRNA pseudouridine(38-40) synthase TruA [Clostridia bacterium]
MKNILLTIEYDGTYFYGWQRQPGLATGQGKIEEALEKLLGQKVEINGTSRTDAGVHALCQKASFKADFGIPVENMKRALNDILSSGETYRGKASAIRITDVREVPDDFHARFNCLGKKYMYIIDQKAEPEIFQRNYAYQLGETLDVSKMRQALKYIEGTHDFESFQAQGGTPRETTVRTIYGAKIYDEGDKLVFEVKGDGFLYNMVRIMVGTLIQVGRGKIAPQDVEKILESKDRQNAGPTAPAEGLYLAEIYFTQEELWKE